MITNLHLTLSDECGANCIFCPKHQTNIQLGNMSWELAKKIIDEISSEEFISKHQINEIQVSHNGDCFFNPGLIRILRYIKEKDIKAKIIMFTNFQLFNKELQQIIISERLIDEVSCNIDSMAGDYYKFIKKLNLEHTLANVKSFISIRAEHKVNIPLTIYVINIHNYVKQLKAIFNIMPAKAQDEKLLAQLKNDYDYTNQQLIKIKQEGDKILNCPPIFWAEREVLGKIPITYSECWCPRLHQLPESFFIAPDGGAFICCLDDEYKHTYGNVFNNTIDGLYNSKLRQYFIDKIKERDFAKLGLPCSAIPSCYTYTLFNPVHEGEYEQKNKHHYWD